MSTLFTFDGKTYKPNLDQERLSGQQLRVMSVMSDGLWRTLSEIQQEILDRWEVIDPEASISSRLRDMRKPRNGGCTIERRRVGVGLNEYRWVR